MTDSRGSHDFPHRLPAELWQEFERIIPRACPARPGQCLVKYRYAVLDVAACHRNANEHKHEDRENMQYTSPHSEGCPGVPVKRKESQTQHDTISNSESHNERTQEPLMVTQEAVEAYERRTGFSGIGRIMVEDGHWIIVTKEELARSRAQAHTNRIMTSRMKGTA